MQTSRTEPCSIQNSVLECSIVLSNIWGAEQLGTYPNFHYNHWLTIMIRPHSQLPSQLSNSNFAIGFLPVFHWIFSFYRNTNPIIQAFLWPENVSRETFYSHQYPVLILSIIALTVQYLMASPCGGPVGGWLPPRGNGIRTDRSPCKCHDLLWVDHHWW